MKKLIESGAIPVVDMHRKLNRYLIREEDANSFLSEIEANPCKYGKEYILYGRISTYNEKKANSIRNTAALEWERLPSLLKAEQIAKLLGYSKNTIYIWRQRFGIKCISIGGERLIPKQVLLDFLASPEFHTIAHKSETHFEMIRRAYHV